MRDVLALCPGGEGIDTLPGQDTLQKTNHTQTKKNYMKNVLIYAAAWLGMVIFAIFNGVLRENVYGLFMSELSAHQLSTLFALIILGAYMWFLSGIFPIESSQQAFLVGGMWLVMTVLFEFIFGHYAVGHSWGRLFHDYNLLKGRIWILVLLWTAVAPYVVYRMRIK